MHDEQPAVVAGVYTQPYNELVRPDRVWKITKYFLRRWTPYLTPSEVWLVIGARQLSYFNERRPWFRAYDRTLAEAAGLHVKVFRRTIKKAICSGDGHVGAFLRKTVDPQYQRKDGVTRQTQTQYTVRLDDPLTPGDAASLAFWLRRNSPQQVTAASVKSLLEEAAAQPARALQAAGPAPLPGEAPDLFTVAAVVALVYPAVAGDGAWREAADTLHTHIVSPELAHFETQYFRRRWLPLLGPGPALLLSYLRSLCYQNEESGEIRDEIALQSGDLESLFQVSTRTLRRWFSRLQDEALVAEDNPSGRFLRVLDAAKQSNQQVLTRYWINLRTPLTAEDLREYREKIAGAADKKFPTLADCNGQKGPHSIAGDGQKRVHTVPGEGQEVAHTAQGDGQKVPNANGGSGQIVPGLRTEEGSYKYYKLLFESAGLNGLEDLQSKIPQQQQDGWQLANGRARASFAAVVAGDSVAGFVDRLGIQEPARGDIVGRHIPVEEAVAWMLYALQEENLERPVSYLIKRLRSGDPPPLHFLQLASLSWEQWRTYAWAWYARPLLGDSFERFADLPLFAEWGQTYGAPPGGPHPADLPFDVGAGLAELTDVQQAGNSLVGNSPVQPVTNWLDGNSLVGAPPHENSLWQAILEELSLQMTRATFDAWLHDAHLVACNGDEYVVAVSSPEAKAWLENRLDDVIQRTVQSVSEGRVRMVRFTTGS